MGREIFVLGAVVISRLFTRVDCIELYISDLNEWKFFDMS